MGVDKRDSGFQSLPGAEGRKIREYFVEGSPRLSAQATLSSEMFVLAT